MAIFIPPKGSAEQLSSITLLDGEIVYNTTDGKFYTGNGQAGGRPIANDNAEVDLTNYATKDEISSLISAEVDPLFSEVSGGFAKKSNIFHSSAYGFDTDLTKNQVVSGGELVKAVISSFQFDKCGTIVKAGDYKFNVTSILVAPNDNEKNSLEDYDNLNYLGFTCVGERFNEARAIESIMTAPGQAIPTSVVPFLDKVIFFYVAATDTTYTVYGNTQPIDEFDLNNIATKEIVLNAINATKDLINDCVKTNDLSAYFDKESIENGFASKDELNNAVDLTEDKINECAKKSDVSGDKGVLESLVEQVKFLQTRLDRMSETDRASTEISAPTSDFNDTTKDAIIQGVGANVINVTAKSVEMKNMTVDVPAELSASMEATNNNVYAITASEDVEIKKSTITSNVPKSNYDKGNTNVIKIVDATSIIIRDTTFNGKTYNTIMTGQGMIYTNTPTVPVKYMLIENCNFEEDCDHISIWAACLAEDAVITINNCHFAKAEQILCLSNFANPAGNKITVNMTNVKVDEYDHYEVGSASEKYNGIIICDDRKSASEAAFLEDKPFSKITINMNNVQVKKNGEYVKLTQDTFKMGEDYQNQMLYVYSAIGEKTYSFEEHSDLFPTVNVR